MHLQFNFTISIVCTDLVSMKKIDLFIEVKVTKMADKTNTSLGGTTRFPVAGQSFYDGYSINYPLQQDKTLIALHI